MSIAPDQTNGSPRVFLFLQGPHCGFFAGLADRLEMEGHTCLRINLCFADWLFWRRKGGVNYRGSVKKWPDFFKEFCIRHRVTDLVLLGEQRPCHQSILGLAKELGQQVTVTEWGYLRPDWLTFEKDGMSGASLFPKDRATIQALASKVREPDMRKLYPDSFARLAAFGIAGDVGNWLFWFLYPGYRSHLLLNPALLYIATGLRKFRSYRDRFRTRRTIVETAAAAKEFPYFVFPMQIEADFQIRAYSPFHNLVEALEMIVRSFARYAPSNARLVVKIHPMDPGIRNWEKLLGQIAGHNRVGDRVLFVDGGSFELLLKMSSGVVTVNSTSGVTALQLGKPVQVLGQAVYDIPGLTHQGGLDTFWKTPTPPDIELRDAFIKAMAGCFQIKGGFFSTRGKHRAIEEAAERLLHETVNRPHTGGVLA